MLESILQDRDFWIVIGIIAALILLGIWLKRSSSTFRPDSVARCVICFLFSIAEIALSLSIMNEATEGQLFPPQGADIQKVFYWIILVVSFLVPLVSAYAAVRSEYTLTVARVVFRPFIGLILDWVLFMNKNGALKVVSKEFSYGVPICMLAGVLLFLILVFIFIFLRRDYMCVMPYEEERNTYFKAP